jgi:hypothetical protein
MRARRWVAWGATLATVSAVSLLFGEDPTPCEEAYLVGGLTQQQMTFDGFRTAYDDGSCAADGPRYARVGSGGNAPHEGLADGASEEEEMR